MQIRLAEQHARFEAALAAAEAKALARGASSAPTSTTAYGPSSGGEDSQSSQPPAGKRKSLKARAAAGLTRARMVEAAAHPGGFQALCELLTASELGLQAGERLALASAAMRERVVDAPSVNASAV